MKYHQNNDRREAYKKCSQKKGLCDEIGEFSVDERRERTAWTTILLLGVTVTAKKGKLVSNRPRPKVYRSSQNICAKVWDFPKTTSTGTVLNAIAEFVTSAVDSHGRHASEM